MKKGTRKKSAIQSGVAGQDILNLMLKMADGVLTTINLSLDGKEDSEAYIPFRILSAKEELDIKDAMSESNLIPNTTGAYELLFIAKRLSQASSSIQNPSPQDIGSHPLLTEHELVNIVSERQLLALGYRYDDFINRHSPKLRSLSQEEINEVVDEISEVLDYDPKPQGVALNQIFCALDLNVMQEVLISCVKLLKTQSAQMDKLSTGI
jgi:hypothetical protein